MGVRGLTTYVARHSDKYLKPYELQHSSLIIDGNSLASLLYNWHAKCNCAFGGDYDKYAQCVSTFFLNLKKCEVSPFVIFDGGYESKKLGTVMKRLRKKMIIAKHITPTASQKFFPLLMKEVFKDVLIELDIPFAQCLYEADDEIAAIARILKCPVLSYDSDFYVYDVMYIPFSTLSTDVSKRQNDDKSLEYYIKCSIYHVDNFLNQFGGLQKSLLPFFATLLGNDYISRSVFKNFYSNYLKMEKSHKVSTTEKYITALLCWLKTETLETAIQKVLSTLKLNNRDSVNIKIRNTVDGYMQCCSDLLPYLGLMETDVSSPGEEHSHCLFEQESINIDNSDLCTSTVAVLDTNISDVECEDESVNSESDSAKSSVISGDDDETSGQQVIDEAELPVLSSDYAPDTLPSWFKEKFLQGRVPSYFMDMVTRQTYYCPPQVEDCSLVFSHQISVHIIHSIYVLLSGNDGPERPLAYYGRSSKNRPEKLLLSPDSTVSKDFGYLRLSTILDSPVERQIQIFLNTLGISESDMKVLNSFPDDWKIYAFAMIYWGRHCTQPIISSFHIHALLLSFVTLNIVSENVGYFKSQSSFLKAYGSRIQIIKDSRHRKRSGQSSSSEKDVSMTDVLHLVTKDDCILVYETLLSFHQVNEKLKSSAKLYSVTTVHAFSQFQSCLMHIMHLNSLLNFPFPQCRAAHFFSGTFIYNAYTSVKKCVDVDSYIAMILRCGLSVYNIYHMLCKSMQELLPAICVKKKQKKKKIHRSKDVSSVFNESAIKTETNNSNFENVEVFEDINNKFSLLGLEESYDSC